VTRTTEDNSIDILLLKQMVETHERKLNQLETDRKNALVAGVIALGSAVLGLLVYLWQHSIGK